MPHVEGSMYVTNKNNTNRKVIRNAVREFKSVSINPLLDSTDVNRNVKNNISNGQILQWNVSGNRGEFFNVDASSVNIVTVPLVNEVFVSGNGSGDDTNNNGKSSTQPFLTFEKCVSTLGKLESFDEVVIYINGDVDYDPASNYSKYGGVGRLREGSFGGNLNKGLIIRGLKDGQPNQLNTVSAPRNLTSQLQLINTLNPLTAGQVTANTLFIQNDSGNKVASGYTIGSNIPASQFPFFKDRTGEYFPIAWDANLRNEAITENSLFYLASHNGVLADITQTLHPYDFAGKVTVNNGGVITNPSFTMNGNVQFVEVHFELQDGVKTPYQLNGEFVILYSKFSKSAGALGTTLELSSYGSAADHTSTLNINSGSAKEGKNVIQLKKSIFEDLTISFKNPILVEDCIFNNCTILNPNNATMSGCVFYNNKGVSLDAVSDDTISYGSSIKIEDSAFIYGTSVAHFNANDNSSIDLNNILIVPGIDQPSSGSIVAQTLPICVLNNSSVANIQSLKIEGVTNQTNNASILYSNSSTVTIGGIVNPAASTSILPLISTDSTKITIKSFDDSIVNTNSLIQAKTSDVKFNEFLVTDSSYTVASGAVFDFESCNISIDGKFQITLDSGVSTTLSIFDLKNSTLNNYPASADGANGGRFNIQNDETQHSIRSWGSTININLGDNAVSTPQLDIHGAIGAYNSNILIKENTIQSPSPHSIVYHGGVDSSVINLINTKLTIENIDIKGLTGTPKALFAENGSNVLLKTCNISVNGIGNPTGSGNGILVKNSNLTVIDGNISVTNTGGLSSIQIEDDSSFIFERSSSPASAITLTGASDASRALFVRHNSKATLKNVSVIQGSTQAILIDNCSSLFYEGSGDGTVSGSADYKIEATTATTSSHNIVEVVNNSKCYIKNVVVEGGGSDCVGIGIHKCSTGVLSGIAQTDVNDNSGVVCKKNSSFDINDSVTSDEFTTSFKLGTKTIAWNDVVSNGNTAPWGAVSGQNGIWDSSQAAGSMFVVANWNAYENSRATISS